MTATLFAEVNEWMESESRSDAPIVVCVEGGAVSKVYAPASTHVLVMDMDQYQHEHAVPVPLDDGVAAMALLFIPEIDPLIEALKQAITSQKPLVEHDAHTLSLAF